MANLGMLAVAAVSGEFASMVNPVNRGPNFTWERFISRAGGAVKIQILMSGSTVSKKTEQKWMDEGTRYARYLCVEAGFLKEGE